MFTIQQHAMEESADALLLEMKETTNKHQVGITLR